MYSSAHIIRVLERNGFRLKSQRGSHTKFVKESRTAIVPHPKTEIPMGTFASILKQSGLSKEDFK